MGTKSAYEGLEYKAPKNEGDSSRTLKGPSVNTEATRPGVATTPATLGPRTA
jgi:hypothetical protein